MCGIAGIYFFDGRRVEEKVLIAMRDTFSHRGPDDAGFFLDQNAGIASRRLSVIDLPGGHQPMTDEKGDLTIVYNGELYNYREMMAELKTKGHRFNTQSDTEVILRAYQTYGADCLEKLRGMFAFAVWSHAKRELFIARDRLGIKPLYYFQDDTAFYFSSEIKGLLTLVKPEFAREYLPEYLANRFVAGENTFFKGIKKLLPGHLLRVRPFSVEAKSYWDIPYTAVNEISEKDAVHQFYELFHEAVKYRLVSDVPLGVFLSGGIDSSAITAAMAKYAGEHINSFSVGFSEGEANELDYARLAARTFKTQHHEIVVSRDMFFEKLPQLVWHEDEPVAFSSSVPLYFVSELARKDVKVVLTGEGSDELLGGYARYYKTLYNFRWGTTYRKIFPAACVEAIASLIDSWAIQNKMKQKLMRTFLYLKPEIDPIYFDNFSVFSRQWQASLLRREFQADTRLRDPYAELASAFHRHPGMGLLDRMLYADIKTYLERLLMKQDRMSMAASVESRVPFLDHRLVEFAANLPAHLKVRGFTTKYLLKKAFKKEIPAEILRRSKMGFPVPLRKWFRQDLSSGMKDCLIGERTLSRGFFEPQAVKLLLQEHQKGYGDHSEKIWLLLNLEIWHRVFIDGEGKETECRL